MSSMIEMDEPIDAEFQLSTDVAPNSNGSQLAVRATYATAMSVPKPRTLTAVERSLLQEARLAGELFYYGWGAGKDRIEGPSVGLMMAAARCWGNCAVENLPVQDAGDAWIFTSAFVDLETGFTISRQFRQSKKWTVYGKHDPERKDDIRFQIGQSKAARNVVRNALPDWLIERALSEAKAGVREKLEKFIASKGIEAARELLVKELAKFGVKPEDIASKFDLAATTGLTIENMVILRGDLSALQNGQERVGALFPSIMEAKPAGKVKVGSVDEVLGSPPKKAAKPEVKQSPQNEGIDEPAPEEASQGADDSPADAVDPLVKFRSAVRTEFGFESRLAKLAVVQDRFVNDPECTPEKREIIEEEYAARVAHLTPKK